MKKVIISFIFMISFFIISEVVYGQLVSPECEYTINQLYQGETVTIPHKRFDDYYFDKQICNYYLEQGHSTGDSFTVMEDGDYCYIIPFENMESLKVNWLNSNSTCPPQDKLQGEDPGTTPNPTGKIGDYFDKENLNLAKVVYEVNKGSLAKKFKTEYNLQYVKAAAINNILVIQYAERGAEPVSLKMTYTKSGNNNKLQSTTIVVTDTTRDLLAQFPFWILESAPAYKDNKDEFNKHTKEELLAAFKDITNYNYTKSGNEYNLFANIPNNVNSQVAAVFSTFLDINPMAGALDPDASTEGQSNESSDDTETAEQTEEETSKPVKNKIKNTKTGAFLDIKVIVIGFVVAFVAGYLVYRHSKIKKI